VLKILTSDIENSLKRTIIKERHHLEVFMKNIVIAFSGKAQSGKTESSKLLREIVESTNELSFNKLSFATKVKEIAQYYFGWNGDKEIYTKTYLDGETKLDGSLAEAGETEVIQDKGRQLLINIGEKFRAIRPTVWADIVLQQIKDLDLGKSENVIYCIDDLRFRNEVKSLREYGRVYFIRLNRPSGQLNLDDITEKDLDAHRFDYYIENDGSVKELRQKLHQIYQDILKRS
jgi:hypothetical protein